MRQQPLKNVLRRTYLNAGEMELFNIVQNNSLTIINFRKIYHCWYTIIQWETIIPSVVYYVDIREFNPSDRKHTLVTSSPQTPSSCLLARPREAHSALLHRRLVEGDAQALTKQKQRSKNILSDLQCASAQRREMHCDSILTVTMIHTYANRPNLGRPTELLKGLATARVHLRCC